MLNALKNKVAGVPIIKIIIEVLVVVVLLPVMTVQIATLTNVSATTLIIFGLFEIFIALAVLYSIGKDTGMIKGSL